MDKRKFLVVVDPSHEEQLALNRILELIRQREDRELSIHLFIGFESDDKSDPDSPDEVVRGRNWRRALLQPLTDLDVEFTAEFFWTKHWQRSIVNAAKRYDCDVIMLSKSSAENKRGITDYKWALLRRAECEVVIVGTDSIGPLKCILASINIQTTDPEYDALNMKILDRGKELADFYGADYHIINAYKGAEDFPDRDRIHNLTGLPYENIHRDMGRPEDIILEAVEKVGADLVILGTKARHGLRASLRGNTGEKVVEKLAVDVMALN